MLQRIQTVYLIVAIVLLSLGSVNYNYFEFITDSMRLYVHGMGVVSYTLDGVEQMTNIFMPFGSVTFFMAIFALCIVLSYKKLSRQLKLIRILWIFYLILLLNLIIVFHFVAPKLISQMLIHSNYSKSFYFLVIGFPFVHLAYLGIRKDKKTIDSLNRLR